MANCPTCGAENPEDSNFCRKCGSRLSSGEEIESTLTYGPAEREALELEMAQPETHEGCPALIIRAGGGREGEVMPVCADVVTIGRSPHSDVFLDDVTVSRHHARVIADVEGFQVEDLNSLNGTYVNRKRIERHRLADGDELQIGKFKLAFYEPEEEGR